MVNRGHCQKDSKQKRTKKMQEKSEAQIEFEKSWAELVKADDELWKFLAAALEPHVLCGAVTPLQKLRSAATLHGIAGVFYHEEEK